MGNEKIMQFLSDYSGVPISNISMSTRLDSDLGLNSLDFVTLLCDIECEYGIHIDDTLFREKFSSTYSVGELINIINHFLSQNGLNQLT